MISSGLFVLPGIAHAKAGPAVVLSYLIAGLLASTGVLSQAELVSAMPKAAADYFYVSRALGSGLGCVTGIMIWLSLITKSSFALVGIAAFASLVLRASPDTIRLLTIGIALLFTILNLIGIREASKAQIALVLGLIGILMFYILKGVVEIKLRLLEPFAPYGLAAIFQTAGFVFVSYGGLIKIVSLAEEVKDPAKTIPRGMFLSLIVMTIVYVMVVLVTAGVLETSSLDNSLTPISDGASAFMGKMGALVLGLAAMLAFITTANAGIMSAARYPVGLARDGFLPRFFSQVNSRFGTPHVAILTSAGLIILTLFLQLEVLVKVASTVLVLSYIFPSLSVIVLRESKIQNYLPRFRSPIYPLPQIVGIVGFVTLLVEMKIIALLTTAVVIAGGAFVYLLYGSFRTRRESALLYLIERITARELTTRSLEEELKQIIRERDDIMLDRFDHLIEKAEVIDIEGETDMEEFFSMVAEKMAPKLDTDTDSLYKLLLKREMESTTVLSQHLAIPHIIIDGNHKFDILLA
ncbi:MAG: amino acid permease, partial [bacterium]